MSRKKKFQEKCWVQHKDGRKGVVTWNLGIRIELKLEDRSRYHIEPEDQDNWSAIPPQEMPKRTWDRPTVVLSPADIAFPADALSWMPEPEEIPPEFWHGGGAHSEESEPWVRFAFSYCLGCVKGTSIKLGRREGIEAEQAWTQISAIARSYAPKHEHKEAAVAWLSSKWFTVVEWEKELPEELQELRKLATDAQSSLPS